MSTFKCATMCSEGSISVFCGIWKLWRRPTAHSHSPHINYCHFIKVHGFSETPGRRRGAAAPAESDSRSNTAKHYSGLLNSCKTVEKKKKKYRRWRNIARLRNVFLPEALIKDVLTSERTWNKNQNGSLCWCQRENELLWTKKPKQKPLWRFVQN